MNSRGFVTEYIDGDAEHYLIRGDSLIFRGYTRGRSVGALADSIAQVLLFPLIPGDSVVSEYSVSGSVGGVPVFSDKVCYAAPTLDTFIDGYRNIEFCQAGIPGSHMTDPFFRDSWHIFISAESNYMQYRFGEVPIWYSCVESVNEEGKTVTHFEDLIGDSEYYNSATNFVNWPTELFHVFSEGPQMTSRTVYRSSPSGMYSPLVTETMEYELADGHTCRGHHIARLKHSAPQIISAPDFSGTDKAYYYTGNIYLISRRPIVAIPAFLDIGGYYYELGTEGIYSRRAFNISPLREQLISKTVIEYRDNGSYTVSQNMEYVEGTGLVARVTDSVIPDASDTGKRGAADIVSTFTYADASAGEVESAMVAANIIGVPLRQIVRDDTDPYRLCRTINHTYSGQVSSQVEHVYDTSTSPWRHWEVHREYKYDDTGAPKSETVTLDTCTVVTRYTYDAAGRLKHTARGLSQAVSGTSGDAAISGERVTRNYTYDVHGWPVKIVTGVPMTLKPLPQHPHPGDIALPYYATAATAFVRDSLTLLIQEKFTEKIYYADGATPRYNGTPSARDLTAGGRYDYRYDSLDRLIAADYTAPADTSDADFSTEYAYDILSRPTSIKRRGVVDIDGRLKEDVGRTILSLSYNTLGLPLC